MEGGKRTNNEKQLKTSFSLIINHVGKLNRIEWKQTES
jgi:hypothetical protein